MDAGPLARRLSDRLESEEYEASVRQLDELDDEVFRRYRDARRNVLEAQGDEKLRTWLQYRLLEPRFDNPSSQMPNLGLSEAEADNLTRFLLLDRTVGGVRGTVMRLLPELRYRHLAASFAVGLAAGLVFALAMWFLARRLRKAPNSAS